MAHQRVGLRHYCAFYRAYLKIIRVQLLLLNICRTASYQLDNVCALQVKKADKGELLTAGVVYVSAGDKCLQICLNDNQMITAYEKPINTNDVCPSVNALFNSAASLVDVKILAIILTGIGDDGTAGAIELKKQGAHVWVQEEKSCAVFGMPKSALLSGVVDQKLSLDEMCLKLREL